MSSSNETFLAHSVTIFTFVNSISILILYLLVFSLFYHVDLVKHKYSHFNKYKEVNEQQIKNLVYDVNYNDQFIKKYLDEISKTTDSK